MFHLFFKIQRADQLLQTLHVRSWKVSCKERDFGCFIVRRSHKNANKTCLFRSCRYERLRAVLLLHVLRVLRRMHDVKFQLVYYASEQNVNVAEANPWWVPGW